MAPTQTQGRPSRQAAGRDASATAWGEGADVPESYDTFESFDSRAGRRAISLLVLSAIMPGSAQMLAGNRTVGRIVLRTWLGFLTVLVVIAAIAWFSLSTVIGLVSAAWFLRLAQWFLIVWAVVWALVILDAWRLTRPPTQPARTRRRLAISTAALMVLPGSVAYAGTSTSAGREALSAVFADGPAAGTSDGRYNILLLGGDSGASRIGTRPDSIQLMSIDSLTGRAATFGFTRDTANIVFEPDSVMAGLMPEGWTCGNECLLNGLYTWAWDHADQFPEDVEDPGILATREAVEALSGLDIQYYAMVDLNGFQNLVDALGGLEINVIRRTPIGGGTSKISDWIEPGVQRLDGYHSLWYARSRAGSSNYERMARQRCVMSAMIDQIDPRTVATRFADLAAASSGVLRTDIPQSELGTFAALAMKTRSQRINGVNFVPPLIKPWDYDVEEIRTIVADTIAASVEASESEATSTSVPRLPGEVPPTQAPDGATGSSAEPRSAGEVTTADGSTGAATDGETPEPFDPLARPSEDANAQTDDIASVCSVG